MADNQAQRKLTAILSADVKGYSRLMVEDDESTVNTITAYREIITELIDRYHGRVVDTPGDNILAEFSSALNVVKGAVDIQRSLQTENDKVPDHRRMEFRIGINLGDFLHKDDRIYGDGVNVAARIESFADPGGICISRGVFDQVKKKVRQGFEYLGEHKVKNITEPVRIYRILSAPEFEGKVIGEPATRSTPIKKPTALAHGLMSQVYLMRYQHDEALAEIERAIAMDPNDPELYAWMSEIIWLMGKNSQAIESANMGLRLDPNNPATYLRQLGKSYLPDGNPVESLQVLERAKRINPELSGSIALSQAIVFGIQGRNEEARTAYQIFLKSRMSPVRNLNDILLYFQFTDPKKLDRIADA